MVPFLTPVHYIAKDNPDSSPKQWLYTIIDFHCSRGRQYAQVVEKCREFNESKEISCYSLSLQDKSFLKNWTMGITSIFQTYTYFSVIEKISQTIVRRFTGETNPLNRCLANHYLPLFYQK